MPQENKRLRVIAGPNGSGKTTVVQYISLQILSQLIQYTHRAYLFDNSTKDAQAKLIAEVERSNKLIIHEESVPWWIEEHLIKPWFFAG